MHALALVTFGVALSVVFCKPSFPGMPFKGNNPFEFDNGKKPCSSPDQYEGLAIATGNAAKKEGELSFVYSASHVSMDFKNERFAILANVNVDQETVPVIIIVDYNCGKAFVCWFEDGHKECECVEFPASWFPDLRELQKIPQDAIGGFPAIFGSASPGLKTEYWIFNKKLKIMETTYDSVQAEFVDENCIPVSHYGQVNDEHKVQATFNVDLFNVTRGIKDPSVFKKPAGCDAVSASSGTMLIFEGKIKNLLNVVTMF